MRNKQVTLADGTRVFTLAGVPVEMLQTQVQEYFTPGVAQVLAGERPVVVDVGANIGLFTLEVLRRTHGQASVYCYEPIPAAFEALASNMDSHGTTQVKLFNKGLAAQAEERDFFFNPTVPLLASLYQLKFDQIVERVQTVVYDPRIDRSYRQAVPPLLERLPPPLLRGLVQLWLRWVGRRTRRLPGEVETLSDLVARERLATIDLLKIDVERAELEVLRGIAPGDWPKIRAVALEVHDLDGRLEAIRRLLTDQSFSQVEVSQEVFYEGSDVYSMYALR